MDDDAIKVNLRNTERLINEAGPKKYTCLKNLRYMPLIELISPFVNKNSPLLDVGIREGALLEILKEEGFKDLRGIDIYKPGVEAARAKGFNCEVASIEEYDLDLKFDIIVMSHVLEHCTDPHKVINNVYGFLNKKGILYVEVPREPKGKIPNRRAHYYFFTSMVNLTSHFDKSKWILLKKIQEGVRMKVVLRKI